MRDPAPRSIYAELDRRLTPGRRAPAGRVSRASGRSGSRCTPATCPPTPSSPGWPRAWGSAALAALDEHGLPDLGLDPALVEQVLPRVRAKLATEPVEDLRVDAEDGYRGAPGRRGRRRAARRRGRGRRRAAGTAPPSVGIRAKSLEGPTRHRGVRSLDLFLGRSVRAAAAGRRHAAEGDRRRAGAGVPARPRRAARPRTGWPRPGAADRDAAGGARPGRHRDRSPGWCTRRPPADRPALRHLRLQRGARHRRRAPVLRPPGGRLRQAGHAGGRRRHRRPRGRRLDQRAAGRSDASTCTPPGGCTPGWCAGRWNAASTRAGTCTPPSWSPGTPPPTPSSGPRCRPPPAGWPPTWTGPTRGVLDEPATARALAGGRAARAGLRRGGRRRSSRPRAAPDAPDPG